MTATVSSVASSASSVTLLAANANASGRTIVNESTSALYVKFGATASLTSYTVQIAPGGYFEVPVGSFGQEQGLPAQVYAGEIDGIWASANGNARLTEW